MSRYARAREPITFGKFLSNFDEKLPTFIRCRAEQLLVVGGTQIDKSTPVFIVGEPDYWTRLSFCAAQLRYLSALELLALEAE